jgi:hypothetical protein
MCGLAGVMMKNGAPVDPAVLERLRVALPDFRGLTIEAFLEKHGG